MLKWLTALSRIVTLLEEQNLLLQDQNSLFRTWLAAHGIAAPPPRKLPLPEGYQKRTGKDVWQETRQTELARQMEERAKQALHRRPVPPGDAPDPTSQP